jgi:hypothetical protein
MWLYIVGFVLLILGIFGTFLGGGIYTIVLLPVGLVILGSTIGYGMWTRAKAGQLRAPTDAHPATNEPLPHTMPRESAHVPTSPEALADARRVEQ